MKIFNKSAWKKVKLGDIFNLQMGKTPLRENKLYWDKGEHNWVSISDMNFSEKYLFSTKEKITDIAVKESGIKLIPKNTVIMSFKLSIGKVKIVKEDIYSNEAIMAFIPKENFFIDKNFLYYCLKSLKWNEGINKAVKGLTLNKNLISQKEIFLPDLAIQKEIANNLDGIDNLLELRKKQLIYLKELSKSLFTRMFGDIRTNSKNWEIKNLDSIYYIRSSKRIFEKDYKKEGVPFFRSKEIVELSNSKNIIPEIYISFDKYEELKKASGIPLKDDLLITAVGTIGKIWKVNYEKDFYFKDGNLIWLQLKNKNQFNTLSLKRILEDSIKNEKENLASGSAYNALTIDKLKKFNIIMPPIELQNKFAERVEKIEKLSFEIEKSIKEAQNLYNSLMNKYFD
ncbi:restriction endonuclease subunit S [Fusobacterium polymorphum]|uniref:restriction endonuclease subunit S n=1 Tax=Fusobacterium nucleatum subsp. polymorphum TaxID=76857 RepID=UPI00236633CF|nr:restriction endonuclease subunit S [Fusobacterium nucleatum]WDF24008.1 restriction endonuclease subunit S [Fusobacterium nucleatum]